MHRRSGEAEPAGDDVGHRDEREPGCVAEAVSGVGEGQLLARDAEGGADLPLSMTDYLLPGQPLGTAGLTEWASLARASASAG